jgi:hypothetical protein
MASTFTACGDARSLTVERSFTQLGPTPALAENIWREPVLSGDAILSFAGNMRKPGELTGWFTWDSLSAKQERMWREKPRNGGRADEQSL